jgi:hypothetical protein
LHDLLVNKSNVMVRFFVLSLGEEEMTTCQHMNVTSIMKERRNNQMIRRGVG